MEHEAFVLRVRIAADLVIQRDGADIEEDGLADSISETLVHLVFEIYLLVCGRDAPGDVETGGHLALKDAAAELRKRCGCSGIASQGEGVEHAPYDRIVELAVGIESAFGEKPHQRMARINPVNGAVVFELKGELVEEGAQERLHRPGGFVEVDVLAQVIAGKQEFLRGGQRLVCEAENVSRRRVGDPDVVHDPIGVKSRFADAGHVSVAHHVIKTVGIEGAGDDCVVHIVGRFCTDDLGDVVRIEAAVLQDAAYVSRCDHLRGEILVRLKRLVSFFGDVFARVFKCVGEGSVSDVVEQCGEDGRVGAVPVKVSADVAYGDFAIDSLDEFARAVEDSDGMGEARVCRRGKHELDFPELRDAPQPLEIRGLEESPCGFFGGDFRVEIDDSVYSVLDSLISCHRGACCCINWSRVSHEDAGRDHKGKIGSRRLSAAARAFAKSHGCSEH